MQDSSTPLKIGTVWAVSAAAPYITYPVPTPSQIGVQNGAGSYTDGFPPNCFVPLSAGGAGPFGKDFNGLLKQITAGLQWLQAGGPQPFDSAFSTLIGGYPQFAIIASATQQGLLWQSTVDNNTANPDTGGANWIPFRASTTGIAGNSQIFTSSATFTVPAGVFSVEVQVVGGGGGAGASGDGSGGGLAGNMGSGGGAGGLAFKRVTGLTPAGTVAVTVGAAGVSGVSNTSTAGGTSSFGGSCSATGGGAGGWGTLTLGAGGAGGLGSGGDLNIQGGDGGFSNTNVSAITNSDLIRIYGRGGLPPWGWGTIPWGGTGSNGRGFGAGGTAASGGNNIVGGNGAPGIVLVRW